MRPPSARAVPSPETRRPPVGTRLLLGRANSGDGSCQQDQFNVTVSVYAPPCPAMPLSTTMK